MTTAARVVELLKSSQNIVVISGAGISANAGGKSFEYLYHGISDFTQFLPSRK